MDYGPPRADHETMSIQQRLHTKLVQKLILTPSLQQAIKLLPMSTLELGELLTQEMGENPMLEEVPSEDLQTSEAATVPEKAEEPPKEPKSDAWDDQSERLLISNSGFIEPTSIHRNGYAKTTAPATRKK